ncbi:MAG: porin family protein [Ginsengibacter sp.]
MKKQILFSCCIALSSFTMAQVRSSVNAKSQPGFGIRAGISSSGMRGDAVTSLNNLLNYSNGMVTTSDHLGFYAGVYASIPAGTNLSIEPGLFYSEKGYDLTGTLNVKGTEFLNANAKAQLQSSYVDIPIVIKATIGGLQLFAGPQISYLTKANLHTTAGLLGINLLSTNMDATAQFNRWDAGLTGGIGYLFTNGINLVASYDYGLTKIDANKNLKAYSHALKLGVGIAF